jgi:hypothetical protein
VNIACTSDKENADRNCGEETKRKINDAENKKSEQNMK